MRSSCRHAVRLAAAARRSIFVTVLTVALVCGCRTQDPEQGQAVAQDRALQTASIFECDDGTAVRARFLGPETIELATGDVVYKLHRTPAASGARYVAADVEFWNKGDAAMFSVGGRATTCRKPPQ